MMFDLCNARKSANLTQRGLADLTGINIRQIQKIESGEIKIENVTLRNAKAIADALNVPIANLLEKEDTIETDTMKDSGR